MILRSLRIPRREFLIALPGLAALPRRAGRDETPLTDKDISEIRLELLKLVNTERTAAGLSLLKLDEFACGVAERHAADMAAGKFLSHWGRDGRKPYHRYSLSGGVDTITENVSAIDNFLSQNSKVLRRDIEYMHMRMHDEKPPDDLHRRNILAPRVTHAGFGVAISGRSLRLAENYLARYVEIAPLERRVKRKSTIRIKGKLLNPRNMVRLAEVFYEPLPVPPEITWLREPRSCGLPDEHVRLRPKLPRGVFYEDGTSGLIEISGREFMAPVKLFKNAPGIYTVVVAISEWPHDQLFSATMLCFESD
jgi:uncharacterized protein YkwD